MSFTIVKSSFGIYNPPTKGLIRNKYGIYLPDIEVVYTQEMHRDFLKRRAELQKLLGELRTYMVGRWGSKRRQRGSVLIAGAAAVVGPIVEFSAATYSAFAIELNPTDAFARLRLDSDGNISRSLLNPVSYSNFGSWYTGAPQTGVGNGFTGELRTISGTLDVGSADTEQALSSSREYGVNQTVIGSKVFSGTWAIQTSGGSTDLDTAGVTLSAEVDV